MKKPIDLALWLYGADVTSVDVEYLQTGTDTADTFVTIRNSKGEKRLRWNTLAELVEVGMDHRSIMRLRESVARECVEWRDFAKRNQHELAEYERLKAKFEGPARPTSGDSDGR